MNASELHTCAPVDISDDDVLAAMKSMQGYIDITPADFREVYQVAYALARQRIFGARRAAEIMTSPVLTVPADADLLATATLLAENGISGAPVIDQAGRVVGVISERDFLRQMGAGSSDSFMGVIAHCLGSKGCVAAPMAHRTAADLMSTPAVTATEDITIAEISALLTEKNINRIPILDAGGGPVGIVTRTDLVNSFCMIA